GPPNPGRIANPAGPGPTHLRLSVPPVADMRAKLDRPTANQTALLDDFADDTRLDWRRGQGITTLTEEDCWGDSTAADDGCYRKVVTNTANRPVEVVARGRIDVQNRL